ncbi:MAG: tetratricopeptide repeat protein, partial [Gemmatimonadota bacterium]
AWWKKPLELFQSDPDSEQDVDYYAEGVELLQLGRYHEALTSFRLALREQPNDDIVRQQIAIVYTRIGMTDEAARTYRSVLERDPNAIGAHYGLAFLLLRAGRTEEAVPHLRAFLASPPEGPAVRRHVEHARRTLAEITGEPVEEEPSHG